MIEIPVRHLKWASTDGSQQPLLVFLNENLRPNAGFSVREEFPSIFQACPGGKSFFIDNDGDIASHVAFISREFRHRSFKMKVGLIGSVVTAERYRGRGYATLLLQRAMEELRRDGCVIAMLWSEKSDFYAPLGFFRGGRERDMRFVLPMQAIGQPSVPFQPELHAAGLWECYRKHEGIMDRTPEELGRLCLIPRSRIFVTERKSEVTSYLAVQKGVDFENYIHEWGGEVAELKRNISWVQTKHFPNAELTMISPAHYDLKAFEEIAPKQWDGVLGLIKVLDVDAMLSTYTAYLGLQGTHAEWNSTARKLNIGGENLSLENEDDIVQLIFGSEKSPVHPVLPFFLWGFDSV